MVDLKPPHLSCPMQLEIREGWSGGLEIRPPLSAVHLTRHGTEVCVCKCVTTCPNVARSPVKLHQGLPIGAGRGPMPSAVRDEIMRHRCRRRAE